MSVEPTELEKLLALRNKIDALDEEIGCLISARAQCAQEVADVKKASLPEDTQILFYRPEREAQVLRKAMERNKGPLSNEEMARLFREIMSACLALESPIKVAYLPL
jgi:chorismate mutase / prephenate dehydratase